MANASPPRDAHGAPAAERPEDLARRRAVEYVVARDLQRPVSLLDRLDELQERLRAAYQQVSRATETQFGLSYAAEWLLDNYYVVQQAIRQIREDMPRSYYRQLPKLAVPPLAGYPRVYALAQDITVLPQSPLDLDRVAEFVAAFQEVAPLTMGETWALPVMLRLAVLEGLSDAAVRVAGVEAGEGPPSPPSASADDVIVANAILSLRAIAVHDWKEFFEHVSLVEQQLRADPAGVYARMEFETRDSYRKEVEALAWATGRPEVEVAAEAVRLAARSAPGNAEADAPKEAHVGFYLIGGGRRRLEAQLGYRPAWGRRLAAWLLAHPVPVYLGGIALLTLAFELLLVLVARRAGGSFWPAAAAALLALVPACAAAVDLANWLVALLVKPRLLPKLDFQEGIPAGHQAIVVIPALISSPADVESLLDQLEIHFLSNTDPHLRFALLTDFADAPQKEMPEDGELLERAQAGITALNDRHGTAGYRPFLFFHRERRWNPAEGVWMAWERKRGKLEEFNRLVLGEGPTSYTVQFGDLDVLSRIRYVITLDADTALPWENARRLVGTLAHPLNRAEFDPDTGRVVAGYTLLQPRVEIRPTSANRSLFTRVFAGDTGLDLYTRAVSDVYQDLFGEGIFVGKGIYDVAAFHRSLAGRVPENTLLSHDLFEGIHGRAGLVTDIVLYEDYPPHYLARTQRLGRWIRGDWQLLPWLWPRVPRAGGGRLPNRLTALSRWKIVDNLRRSLLAPALLALLVAGWLWLPGPAAFWTLVGVLALAMPLLSSLASGLVRGLLHRSSRGLVQSLHIVALRWALALIFLPYEAIIALDAIVTTLVRLTVTRRHLLQWTTAAHAARLFERRAGPELAWSQMIEAWIVATGLGLIIALANPGALPAALPLLLAWLVSPQVAYWISRPLARRPTPLSPAQHQRLHTLARRTWLFFERFAGPDDQWLPPDHFQEEPRGAVAHRTSPTNIGLYLLSTLAAHDFGYIGHLGLTLRLRDTLETMGRMERHRGHFLNWYATLNLEPLAPRYVSTVDSGNLGACLIALKQGCLEIAGRPILRWERWQGLLDTLAVFVESLSGVDEPTARAVVAHLAEARREVLAVQGAPERWPALLARLSTEGQRRLQQLLTTLVESGSPGLDLDTLRNLRTWSERLSHHLTSLQREYELLVPWLIVVDRPPELLADPALDPEIVAAHRAVLDALSPTVSLNNLGDMARAAQRALLELQLRLGQVVRQSEGESHRLEAARSWCFRLSAALDAARMSAGSLLVALQDLAGQAEATVQAMDFRFLYDPDRRVFHIGYNVATGQLDRNYYDLLASESRIASLLAIAKDDVPPSHWLHLARPLTQVDGYRTLLSWSGTMFEYLMPSMLMRDYEGTFLAESARGATAYQMAYGRQRNVPWGISESGYYHFDGAMNYQYRAFGVPGLGFKRGLGDDLVITPYASILAISVAPQAVVDNLSRLLDLDMMGLFGFYEAVDYTESRLALGQKYARVQSYMAHHQGMILLSLANFLLDQIMVRRFHEDPRIKSVELLLQERVPREAPVEHPQGEEAAALLPLPPPVTLEPWRVPVDAPVPQVHLLSNGRYAVLLTGAGGGVSRWQDTDLTRWRADTTLDEWGTWIYVQDQDDGHLWSAAYQPTAVPPDEHEVLFYPHQAQFRRRDRGVTVVMDVAVPPDDDLEIRRLTLTNHSGEPRRLRVTSYGEIVLAPQAADRRHPAFNKLFIESEYLPDRNALVFRRRPRSSGEPAILLAHWLVAEQGQAPTGRYEGNRLNFLERGQTPRTPAGLLDGSGLSGEVGATLDPILALSQEIALEPYATARLAFFTGAAGSQPDLLELIDRYRTLRAVDRALDQARALAEREMRRLDLTTPILERIEQLHSVLFYPHPALRADPETLAANAKGQPGLWPYTISGDYPILLVRVDSEDHLPLVRELLQAHAYWRERHVKVDLVVLNRRESGYDQELQDQLYRTLANTESHTWLGRRGGIFLLAGGPMPEADQVLLAAAARAVFDGGQGSLAEQMAILREHPVRLPALVPSIPGWEDPAPTPSVPRPAGLAFDNGLGGFSPDGREYQIYLEPGRWTPAPWVNVIANPEFGFLVSEAGASCTWAVNSGENRLTPWFNDPVSDPTDEALYLRDEETGVVWSPTPLPAGAPAPTLVRHGAGYSVFEHHSHGLRQALCLFAAPEDPVKIVRLRLENTWDRVRRVTATYYAAWVLGTHRDESQPYIIPEFYAEGHALLARNPYNAEFGERVAFVAATQELHGLTTDRMEFLGRMGSRARPAALERIGLANVVAPGLDPCAVLQIHLNLEPGEATEVRFLVGQGAGRAETLRLIEKYQDAAQADAAWEGVNRFWDEVLGTVTVRTPDPAMDLLLNRWLLTQTLSCRLWGRSALYQSGGAFGFRDQLQDVMALVLAAPHLAREHILRAAHHQFEAGDVLHWWHPPSGRGVRTRFSDDLLWLPLVTAHYVAATGDLAILSEEAPFLKGAPLEPGEEERYGLYEPTTERYSLYEHCRRALERGTTAGPHGLPLIGGGDWNDGMNRVGIEGRGESVWMAWFLYTTLTSFASVAEAIGEERQAAAYRWDAENVRRAVEAAGWDGNWYLRAYYDDGTPLGSARNRECQIDSLTQSWAALSGAANPLRVAQAMDAVADRLVRLDDRLILLFTPPFDQTPHDPGYIKGYLPGIRENGGQYTHAALWVVWAFAELGQGDEAYGLFRLLNPITHGDTPADVRRYRVEPYVVAADVYSVPPHNGRGGWTWYTGSAGWMYRLGVEAILGLTRQGDSFQVNPCIPRAWAGYEIAFRHGAAEYRIQVENPDRVERGVRQVTLDGQILPGPDIPLRDDGRAHEVVVRLGRPVPGGPPEPDGHRSRFLPVLKKRLARSSEPET